MYVVGKRSVVNLLHEAAISAPDMAQSVILRLLQ